MMVPGPYFGAGRPINAYLLAKNTHLDFPANQLQALCALFTSHIQQ